MTALQHRRLYPELVKGPTTEPITLTQAKKQLEIASDDDTHDSHLTDLITDARQQWENDTDTKIATQTWKVITAEMYDGLKLPMRPVQSVTSITYYDTSNTFQTLPTSQYQLHVGKREIRRAYLVVLPVTLSRWDAWTITYVCGYAANEVPGVARRAMMNLIGYNFDGNRGDNDRQYDLRQYERLVQRFLRSDYP
jgi:uncharacterized phiE125 gp8 family phage protein